MTSAILLASNPEITDVSIIDQVLNGNKGIYEVIVRRYNTKLYRVAKGILKDEDEIEDAMQNTYIKAYEKLGQFKREAQFSTWLTRILINEALASLKRSNKLQSLDSINLEGLIDDDFHTEIEESEILKMRASAKNLLETSIANLSEKYRAIFILREIEQLSVSDAATLLEISEENVKVRLHRAKGLLKNSLKDSMKGLDLFEFLAPKCNKLTSKVMSMIEKLPN